MIVGMSGELKELWQQLKMCEYYLNNYTGRTSVQYYTRLRHAMLKDILHLQIVEFDR